MTKHVKNFKVREIKSHVITGMLALTAVLLLLIFLKHVIENGYAPRESVSTPETISVNPLLAPESPRESASTLAQGSFTELFSGAGWMNSEKTNVYQDDKLSSISFPPDYEWQEIPALSDSIKNETIIAANGNGKEIVLVAKSGKIMSLRGAAGDEAISSSQSLIINNQLKNALLDYDDAKQTWVVAAVSENGEGFIGPIEGHISPISFGGSQSSLPAEALAKAGIIDNQLDLACANGECLVLAGSNIYRFAENNPSALIRVDIRVSPLLSQENPRESASMLSLGKAGNILLVGAVEKIDGIYNGSIYKYSASASPEPSAKAGGSLIRVNPLLNDNPRSSASITEVPRPSASTTENPRESASMFSSSYPGTIRFGYDKENSEILALYAAYIGQAYKLRIDSLNIRVNPLLARENPRESASTSDDFSRFFPQRVMDGNNTPKIFKHGNAWWLSSEVEQLATKFIRIEGGAGIDFADTLIRGQQAFELLPGFDPRESASINNTNPRLSASTLYALAVNQQGAKIYKFIDKGYKKDKKLVWESLRLNRFDDEIVSGRFYKIHGSANGGGESEINSPFSKGSTPQGGGIYFYISNDGGKNWREAKLNEKIDFQTKGNDFRFKVEINPDADVSQTPRESASTAKTIRVNPPLNFQTPWLNLISVEYYSKP